MQAYEIKGRNPDSHEIKYEEIVYAILQDENILKSQNIELTRHINTLEIDRLKLIKKLM